MFILPIRYPAAGKESLRSDGGAFLMYKPLIQQTFLHSYHDFLASDHPVFWEQQKTSNAIINCKSGNLGYNLSECSECGHKVIHANSCRNRNCPNCQAVKKEIWVDKRRSEVIDTPYFHVVFTLPHELNPLLYCNQKLLYDLLHRCTAETLLELSADKKYLGATPGIIQVLHTWNQELGYHIHMHCIVSGGGITSDLKLRKSKGKFFIPVYVLRDKFKGKFLHRLHDLFLSGKLAFSSGCSAFSDADTWYSFKDSLYKKTGVPISRKL
jgi:Putative transposase.